MIRPPWLRTIVKKMASMNRIEAVKWMKKETDYTQIDENHFEIKSLKDEKVHFKQWNMFDLEGVVGHGILDTAATIGLIREDTLKKWEQAYKVFGVEDGIRIEDKRTKLRYANNKTKISKKKA